MSGPAGGAAGCACDECARKAGLLRGLELAASLAGPEAAPPELVAGLREDLERHRRRAALLPDEAGDRTAILRASERRPWLSYDPDALLPQPFDAFLLGGVCPRVPFEGEGPSSASVCYLLGCGRSGTTVLAELLSRRGEVVFLNEPRQLWVPALPAMDVWSVAAPRRRGRLAFAAEDADVALADGQTVAGAVGAAYRDIAAQAAPAGGPPAVVLEKFPEHAFRLPLLAAACGASLGAGRCSFLHLVRDGVDVARSIARFEPAAAWYGVKGDWKWGQLAALSEAAGGLDLSEAFGGHLRASRDEERLFARGLVEWALSVRAARDGHGELQPPAPWLEVRYEELLARPAEVIAAIEALLGLGPCEAVRRAAAETLRPAPEPRPLGRVEAEVLLSARGSRIEGLLRECGRALPWDPPGPA